MKKFTKRQEEILQASMDIIAESGIQNMTLKNLSEKMGISEPAFYKHFTCKNNILLSVLQYFSATIEEAILKISNNKNLSALEKIESLFMLHINNLNKNKSLSSIIFSDDIFKNNDELSVEVIRIMLLNEMVYKKITEEGKKNSEFKDDMPNDHIPLMLLGTLSALVKKWSIYNYGFDIVKEGQRLFSTLKVAIKK